MAFPRGLPPTDVPVHPTQLYEAIPLVGLAVLLTRLRAAGTPDRRVFGIYLLLAGLLRFAIEFLRVDERVLLGLSVAHLASLGAMLAGAALLATAGLIGAPRRNSRATPKTPRRRSAPAMEIRDSRRLRAPRPMAASLPLPGQSVPVFRPLILPLVLLLGYCPDGPCFVPGRLRGNGAQRTCVRRVP